MTDDILVVVDFPDGRQALAHTFLEAFRDHFAGRSTFSHSWEYRFTSAASYQLFRQALTDAGLESSCYFVRWERKYTQRELLAAHLLRVIVRRPEKGHGGPTFGTRYDLSAACRRCGTGARQDSPLVVKPNDIEKRGDVTQTLDDDLLVSARLADLLRGEGFTGVDLRAVESVRPERPVSWFQVVAQHELPPMSDDTRGIITERQCPLCKRDGFFDATRLPDEIVYSSKDVDLLALPDFVRTWEHFGNSMVLEPLAESHFAQPLLLVKPKVYELLRRERVRGLVFSPVRIA